MNRSKAISLALGCCTALAPAFAATTSAPPADPIAPQRLPLDLYDEMVKKSPFAPATPPTPVEARASFTSNYYVAGVARIGGKDFVTVVARDTQARLSLAPGEQGPEGITIQKVEWSEELGKSKVTMKKGEETGVVPFDQAAMRPAVPMPVAPPVRTPFPPTTQGIPKAAGSVNVPPPVARLPLPVPAASPERRRIRIINSPATP